MKVSRLLQNFLSVGILLGSSMDQAHKAGEELGQWTNFLKDNPGNLPGPGDIQIKNAKPFDSKAAYQKVLAGESSQDEVGKFLNSPEVQGNARNHKGFDEGDYFLRRAESITQGVDQDRATVIVEEEGVTYSRRTCQQPGGPFTLVLVRYREELAFPQHNQSFEEGNLGSWIYDDPHKRALALGPDCSLIEERCLDEAGPNELDTAYSCRKQSLKFLCKRRSLDECAKLQAENCQQISQECLQPSEFGCALFKKTFKCFDIQQRSLNHGSDLYGLENPSLHSPNESFAQATTKLALLDEIKKDIESSGASDARKVALFKGQPKTCSKNVASSLFYDCCFSHKGLATKLKLAHCTAEEIQLADLRERGLCTYIGKYSKKIAGLWKSRDIHVFCSFPSKLARVFQEQARRQLGLGWGSPKKPNCMGLTPDQIGRLDLSTLDLSELYEDRAKTLPNLEEKMKSFQFRLSDVQKRLGQESQLREEVLSHE